MTAGVPLLHLNKLWMLLICSVEPGRFSKRANELLEAKGAGIRRADGCALIFTPNFPHLHFLN